MKTAPTTMGLREWLPGLGSPRSWSDAVKCIVMAAIALPLVLWAELTLRWVRADPATLPYVDARFAERVVLPLVDLGFIGGLAAVVVAGLLRSRTAASPLLVRGAIGWAVVVASLTSYLHGHFTSLFPAIVLVGLAPAGLLLFEARPIRVGVAAFLVIVVTTTVASQMGWIPYAPLFRDAPFTDGRLASSWLLGFGGVFFILLLASLALVSFTILRARADEEALARTTGELERTNAEIGHASRQLAQAYEDLESTQAQLVQSERMASLGQLVAGVAHELNNPTSFLLGGLANLEEALDSVIALLSTYQRLGASDPALARATRAISERTDLAYLLRETPELLRICRQGSERIRRIVDDLRAFARADSGEREVVDVAGSIDGALHQLDERPQRAGVALRREYAEEPHTSFAVEASPVQLKQVWASLIENALDAVAARPDAEIRITIRRRDGIAASDAASTAVVTGKPQRDVVEVDITDNGPGIPPEVMSRVFEPFFTTKPIGHGTGLGLSIAYGVVTSHGGELTLTSEPNRGTRVRVRLPADALDASKPNEPLNEKR